MFSLFGRQIFCTHPWLGASNLVPADFLYSDVGLFQYIAQGYRIYRKIFVQGGILRSYPDLSFLAGKSVPASNNLQKVAKSVPNMSQSQISMHSLHLGEIFALALGFSFSSLAVAARVYTKMRLTSIMGKEDCEFTPWMLLQL